MLEHSHNHDDFEKSSERAFGLTVGGIFLLIEGYRYWHNEVLDTISIILLCIALPLLFFGAVYPRALKPFNTAWTHLGLFMFKVVNPIVMFAVFILTIIPIGLLLRLFGKDPLRLKMDKTASSYWIERDPKGPAPESMKNQF